VRWGPRTLDVDVVVAAGSDPARELPHPRAHQRAMVLVPWLDLDPDAELPGHGRVADLVVDRSTVRRVGAL
jgi:7,8-dihydro-6-hydroxymethylpterin-pyrophosphokinase